MSDILTNLLTGPLLVWLPKIFFGLVFLFAVYLYYEQRKNNLDQVFGLNYKRLVILSISFYIFFAALLTAGQYYVWSQSQFTRIFISTPLDQEVMQPIVKSFYLLFSHKLGYFMFYALGRFWLEILLAIGGAYLLHWGLKVMAKYRGDFFEYNESQLGLLTALIVGWPNLVVFLILGFVSAIIVSIYRRIAYKELYTTFGLPFLIGCGATLLLGDYLVRLLGLTVLKV